MCCEEKSLVDSRIKNYEQDIENQKFKLSNNQDQTENIQPNRQIVEE